MAVSIRGMAMLETTLTVHKEVSFEGCASLISRILFTNLFARVGDQNSRLREAAEDILLQMAGRAKLVGPAAVLSYATRVAISADTKPKAATGRLQLANKILEKHVHQLIDQQ